MPLTPPLFGRSFVAIGKPFALFGLPCESCQPFGGLFVVGVDGVFKDKKKNKFKKN